MDIEKRRTFDPARLDAAPTVDVSYGGEVEDRTFAALPAVVRSQVEQDARRRGVEVDTSLASMVWPDRVKRTRSGDVYRQRLAWVAGHAVLVLVDARQGGRLESGRFRPAGAWRADTVLIEQPKLKHSQQPPRDSDNGGRSVQPTDRDSLGYYGRYPEVWTALPTYVNGAIQHFIPDTRMTSEYGYAMIEWSGDTITERHWYDRRAGQRATAVFMVRSCRTRRTPSSAEAAAKTIRGEPWTVTAWRAAIDAAATGREIPNGIRRR